MMVCAWTLLLYSLPGKHKYIIIKTADCTCASYACMVRKVSMLNWQVAACIGHTL